MPYALRNPQDGSPVTDWYLIDSAEDALEDEVVVSEFPHGKVWDATAQKLRPPTDAETLEPMKAQKVAEMHAAALEELSPLFTDSHGKDELIFLLAAHVRRILGAQADPRLGTVEEVGEKALAKRDEIQGAQSVEELEAVVWN
jgi:hypothetical protein